MIIIRQEGSCTKCHSPLRIYLIEKKKENKKGESYFPGLVITYLLQSCGCLVLNARYALIVCLETEQP